MRFSAMFWVIITTLVLITVTIMVSMGFPFNWIFYITVAGQLMLVYMVYKVLVLSNKHPSKHHMTAYSPFCFVHYFIKKESVSQGLHYKDKLFKKSKWFFLNIFKKYF